MTLSAPTILTASPDDIALDNEGATSYSNILTLVGTAAANSIIAIYDGGTELGTATTNSSGTWTYTTPTLTDGAQSFTATATLAGSTSVASTALSETVAGSIANFSPLTDQWSSPITVGGMHYYVENANTNGNAPWAITEVNDHTLQFQVQPNDLWPDNDSHRSEVSGATIFAANATVTVSYQFQVQPGFNDTSDNLAWQILGQFHADDNNATYQSISGGEPMLAFHLTGPNGLGEGNYLAVQVFYALPGQTSFTAATLPGNPLNGYLYVSPTPILQGEYINMQVEASFQNNSNGFVEVWINGAEVVNYHGPVGYGGGVYWKEGVYEGWSSNQTITVDYANTVVTAAPGAPLILNSAVNGNQAMLGGTAEANSTITIYNGTTALGTTTTSGAGAWFFETAALANGTQSLTAKATDTAGNVSAASSAVNATIAAFTGPIIKSVATSAANGETVRGSTITFTLNMSSATTVTGTPTLSLNDGGTATYTGGSGTNGLTFSYTVGAGDTPTTGLAITGLNLPNGATIQDGSGNSALLAGAAVQFPSVIIDSQPVQTPVFGSPVANSNGTFTFTGTAGANTTVYFETSYSGGLGSAVVDSSGHWTFTTATLTYNTWNVLQAYDVNSLGDVSAIGVESGGGFGDYVNLPASPTITGNALVGSAVTLYGMVASGESITSVAVYDGSTKLGSTTINTDGSWSFTTSALANGIHSFAATATNASGTSGASVTDSISVEVASASNQTTINAIAESPSSGDLNAGKTVTFTVAMSDTVTVNTTGGTPTLTLSDGGIATYTGGTGSSALTFSYTVGAGQNSSDLTANAINLNNATITDSSGNAPNLSLSGLTQAGPQIDTTAPTVSSVATSGTGITSGSGDLGAGKTVTFTVAMSEAVTANTTGGTPTLTLSDGGIATYTGGTGSSALTFSYTVSAGQNSSDLTVTAYNPNGGTITDGAGNAATMTGAVTNPAGTLQIDTTAPTVSSVATSGTGITSGSGDVGVGKTVTFKLTMSEAVTVNTTGGTPTLTLSDGGIATYTGGTGSSALTFSYTVSAGQNSSDLTVTAYNANGGTITDGAGNAATMTGAVTNPAGTLQIDTTAPTVSSVATSGSGITSGSGDVGTGSVVTFTVAMSEAVTVNTAGGTPTLTLSDGGIATYTGGTGSSALTFSYTVSAGQNSSDLTVTAYNANGGTITDGAGNAATMTGAVTNPAGTLQIDTTAPTVSSVATSGTGITSGSGDLGTGSVVTFTVAMSDTVTVNTTGGTPTLTLSDGGIATYTGGTGSSALTFSYTVGAGQNSSDLTITAYNANGGTITDGAGNAASMTGAVTNPAGTLQIDTTAPTVSSVATSGTGITSGSGDLGTGSVVTFTVAMSEAVTVNTTGGTPTLTLSDGGIATYTGGTGSSALTFSYTVGAGQNSSDLTVTAYNANGGTITDGAGNAASMTGAVTDPAGTLQIDTTAPTVSSVATSGTGITSGSGDLGTGSVVTFTVAMSEAVTVNTTGGTPTLTLSDGGIATYTGGTGSSALTFSYTVGAGQNSSDLTANAINLNNATITDSSGNAPNLSLSGLTQAGPQIDTTAPTVSSVATSGTGITSGSGDLGAGKTVTFTVAMSEAVTANTTGGTPTLTLSDGGIATYTGGTGSSALTFSYTVSAGQNSSDLTVTAYNPNGGTITDGAGNAATMTGAVTNPAGTLQIDTTAPTVSSVATSGTGITSGSGDVGVGKTVTFKLTMSEAVTVNTTGGTPTLTLSDGGIATYTGGTGSSALTFSYTVSAGQNSSDLTVTAYNANGGTITDGAGNAATMTGAVTNPAGTLQIDTTAPTVSSVATSGSGITSGSGDVGTGSVVTFTVAMSEAVTVNTAGGTPTLTLSDGGIATYTGGTGSSALTFSYTVSAGQNSSDLTVSAYNANGGTITDGAGNAATMTGAVTNPAGTLQIDITAPTVSSVATSGTGITSGSGDLGAGKTVTFKLTMSEAVTVNTTGGTPTLTLSDGGIATYTGGTGSSALTFSYTVGAGQNSSDLTITAYNANGGTITDGAGNAASMTGAVTNPAGTLQIDTTTSPLHGRRQINGQVVGTGAVLIVSRGVLAELNTIDAGGSEIVLGGGTDVSAVISGGSQIDFGIASGATIFGGQQVIKAGGVASGSIVSGGGVLSDFGSASRTVVSNAGTDFVQSGGVETGAVLLNGGTEFVEAHGMASRLTLSAGGVLANFGSASGTIVRSGGLDYIQANGVEIGATLFSGGVEYVEAGGKTLALTVSSGGIVANYGGSESGTLVVAGGQDYLESGAVESGGVTRHGGAIFVESGGTEIGVTASGLVEVFSGGVISGTVTFGSGGELQLADSLDFTNLVAGFSGTTVKLDLQDIAYMPGATTVNWMQITSGVHASGTLTVSGGGHAANIMLIGQYATGNFAISGDGGTGTLVTDPPLARADSATTLINPHHA